MVAFGLGFLLWSPGLDVQDGRHDRRANGVCLGHGWLAVMMYDAGQRIPKTYQHLMADWTQDVLSWSGQTPVLLGVPTYDDAGVDYHHPEVENLTNALLGIHRGLSRQPLPAHYQGIAIYCEWETAAVEWGYFRQHFLSPDAPFR